MSEYQIRKLKSTEFHLLVPLMENCFGLDVNVQYFKWKFVDNPAGFVVGFIAIAEDGEVAAYYGAIPEEYSIDGQVTTIYQSCDTMTHSRHRRKGLFQKLATHCYHYLDEQGKMFVIGFGGAQSTPGLLKFGWKHLFTVHHYFYLRLFSRFRLSPADTSGVIEIKDYATLSPAILQSNGAGQVHSHKSLPNFLWRIANPQYSYKTIGYSKGGSACESWLTYYIATGRVVLFDFYFADSGAGKKLIGYLKKILAESGAKGIVAFCQEDSVYSRALSRQGFIYNPFSKGPLSYKTPFLIYADEATMQRFGDKQKWLVNSFDYDAM